MARELLISDTVAADPDASNRLTGRNVDALLQIPLWPPAMVKITVSPAVRKLRLAPDLPATLEIPEKTAEAATVADVKTAFAAKYPKARFVLDVRLNSALTSLALL